MGVLLGVGAALSFGAADFFGGLASRRISSLLAVFFNQMVAVPFFLILVFVLPMTEFHWLDYAKAGAGGVGVVVVLQLLYRVLRVGAMGVLAAVTGIMSAVVPFVWALLNGERVTLLAGVGIAVALLAIVVVSKGPNTAKGMAAHRKQVVLAALAGMIFGVTWVAIASMEPTSGAAPLVVMRVAGAFSAGILLVGLKKWQMPNRVTLAHVAVAGVSASVATLLFLFAGRINEVAVVSVLQGMAPLATAGFAFAILGQRLALQQIAGIALAIASAVLLAL